MVNNIADSNKETWEAWSAVNASSPWYLEAMNRIESTGTSLYDMELGSVGNVAGKKIIHLHCHLGMDSVSWALKGATVTGIDYSEQAIQFAQTLNGRFQTNVQFHCCNVYDLPPAFNNSFDIVFCSYGIIHWLEDLDKWFAIVHNLLRPKGMFYIIDFHPLLNVLDKSGECFEDSYFDMGRAVEKKRQGSYVNRKSKKTAVTFYNWHYPLSKILDSCIAHGLEISEVKEYPFSIYKHRFRNMKKTASVFWQIGDGKVPMLFSLKAIKK